MLLSRELWGGGFSQLEQYQADIHLEVRAGVGFVDGVPLLGFSLAPWDGGRRGWLAVFRVATSSADELAEFVVHFLVGEEFLQSVPNSLSRCDHCVCDSVPLCHAFTLAMSHGDIFHISTLQPRSTAVLPLHRTTSGEELRMTLLELRKPKLVRR
jgi:hypothetical protein